MIVPLFTSILILIGQSPASSDYGVPYGFELRDGTRVYGLAHRSDVDDDRKVTIEIRIEQPWKRVNETHTLRKRNIVDSWIEQGPSYKARIDGQWKANGGIRIDTAQGKKWILQSEYDLARRALAMTNSSDEIAMVQGEEVAQVLPTPESVDAGFFTQWWLHGVIGMVAIALSGIAVWWGFLRFNWFEIG